MNIARPSSVEPVSTLSSTSSAAPARLGVDRVEGRLGADAIQREERDGEDQHHDEHAPAHGLAQRVARRWSARRFTRPPRPPRGRCPRASTTARAPRRRARPRPPAGHDLRHLLAPGLGERPHARLAAPPPRRGRCASSAGLPRATIAPPTRIATRSQTRSTSLSRCELSSTATPRRLQLQQQVAHDPAPDRVERAGRLVEHQQARACPTSAWAMPEPLLHALRHGAHSRAGRVARGRPARAARRRSLGAAVRAGQALVQRQQLVGAQPVGKAEQLGQVADRRARRRRARPARPPPRASPPDGRTSPQAIFTSVDLPAPFGPSSPTSSPGWTSRSTPASATVAP